MKLDRLGIPLPSQDPEKFLLQSIESPTFHIKYVQGIESLEPYQVKICDAVKNHDRIAVKAVHAVGKTFLLARIIAWFMSSHEGAQVLSTAPTARQVQLLLWKELRNAHKRALFPLGGKIYDTPFWKIDDDWFAIGYSPDKEAGDDKEGQGSASAFQGFHSENIMIVFDEATGIKKQIWTQAEGMLTSGNTKFIAVGNPTSKQTEFYSKFRSKSWRSMGLSCFDSPNLKANGIKTIYDIQREVSRLSDLNEDKIETELKKYKCINNYLIDTKFVIRKALPDEWGVDHILFITKVLGEFADEDENTLIPLSVVNEARIREGLHNPMERYIGVDPARFGIDKTVISIIEGYKQTMVKRLTKKSTTYVSGEVIKIIKNLPRATNKEILLIDATGIGAGVVDNLIEAQELGIIPKSILIFAVHFGAKPIDKYDPKTKQLEDRQQFFNLKAKMFDLLAKDLQSKLQLLDEDVYSSELPTILYQYTSKGQIKIESKDEYKKRTGRNSPDDSDALAITNFGRYIKYHAPHSTAPEITVL